MSECRRNFGVPLSPTGTLVTAELLDRDADSQGVVLEGHATNGGSLARRGFR
jgi:hypothetical protein